MKKGQKSCSPPLVLQKSTYDQGGSENKKELDPVLAPQNGDRVMLLAGDYNTDPVLLLEKESNASRPSDELLTIPEVAKWFKVSESMIRRLQQSRKIPFKKIGGVIRFLKSEVLIYLQGCGIGAIA